MATKKKAAPKAEAVTAAPEPAPEPEAPAAPEVVLAGDIDARMAAVLKDHQAMGARPK